MIDRLSGFTFGATDIVYGSDGAPVQFKRLTREVCKTCYTETRAVKMGVLRDDSLGTSILCCPNCGETLTKNTKDVQELPVTE